MSERTVCASAFCVPVLADAAVEFANIL